MFIDENGRQHERNIDLLVLRFGNVWPPEEIRKIYDTIRSQQEEGASVTSYMPSVTMYAVKKILSEKVQEKSLPFV